MTSFDRITTKIFIFENGNSMANALIICNNMVKQNQHTIVKAQNIKTYFKCLQENKGYSSSTLLCNSNKTKEYQSKNQTSADCTQ